MYAYARAVDHLHVAVVGRDDGVHQALPHPCLAPAVEAVVAGRVGPVILRQVTPRRPRAQHPENAAQHSPVVYPRHPARLVRQ